MFAIALYASDATPTASASPSNLYLHQTWQFEDGLPQNVVQAICQTRDGYIWVGTQNGLARFDGVYFTVFNAQNTPELRNARISALRETRDGSLWIGTDGGGLVCLKDGRFKCYTSADGLASNTIRCLFEAKDGVLWIGTLSGKENCILSFLKDDKFQKIEVLAYKRGHAVRAICEDKEGAIWVATSEGFAVGKGKDFKFEPRLYLRTVFADRDGHIWFSSTGGMWRNGEKQVFTKADGLADSNVTTLFEDSSGTMWIGSYGGLSRRTNDKFYAELNKEGISYDVVNVIFEDREKNIWIGAKDGLSRLASRRFFSYTTDDGLAHNNVMSVSEGQDGEMWIGTWGGGLNRLKNGAFTVFNRNQGLSNDLVLAVHQTRDGTIWFGNDFTAGLHTLRGNTVKRTTETANLPPLTVKVILEDKNQNLWVGTQQGLLYWRQQSDTFRLYTTNNGLPTLMTKALCEDNEGALWIGTPEGLCRFHKGEFKTFSTADGLGSKNIASIFEDTTGTLWVGTVGGGLSRRNGDRFATYTTQQGLFSDDVWEILEDDAGCLWMSSRVGVSRVEKSDFEKFDRGAIQKIPFTSFGKYDGMVSIECNSVAKPSAYKSRDGRLWFATAKGLSVIDPKQEDTGSETAPTVLIESVNAGKEKITSTGEIELSPGQRDLEFHYTALSFRAPQKVRFKYRLEGVDEDWVQADTRRVAFYNNLAPGKYRFQVIACNSHGFWNETGAISSLTLKPHFYQAFWFYGLCAAGLVLCAISIYKFRVRSLKRYEQHLEALVAERTKNLETEIAERQRIQTELIGMSRKAGMAEVASGVLHNVGNVLNSVNVSVTLAGDRLRNSKLPRLDQAATLMTGNAHDLPAFAATEQGRKLPGYLKLLAQHLTEEQQLIVAELDSLHKNIDHIKDIVAMQQSLAKVNGVVELVRATELIEDALQINLTSLTNHNVRIVRNFKTTREISVEKHKVLQILINILRNAKHACVDGGRVDKQINVTVEDHPADMIQISIRDNGVGIPPENLTRIFSHGFTTRKNGHGFGLHSAANTARELGGSLSVSSDGQGKGATFVLQLPVQQKSADHNPRSGPSLRKDK